MKKNARASLHRGKTIFYQSQQKSWSESKFLNEYGKSILKAKYNEYLEFRTNSITEMIKATFDIKEKRITKAV